MSDTLEFNSEPDFGPYVFTKYVIEASRERKASIKQRAKRDEQIERVMVDAVGMYSDLQGIAGKSLQEIEALSLAASQVRVTTIKESC